MPARGALIRMAIAIAALVALAAGAAAAQAPAPPFQLVATTPVGPQPGKATYGYGAVWTLNGNGTVSRLDTSTGAVRTVSVGPNPRDIRAAYNRIWVLRSTKSQATVVRLDTSSAAKVGNNITINLGSTVDVGRPSTARTRSASAPTWCGSPAWRPGRSWPRSTRPTRRSS